MTGLVVVGAGPAGLAAATSATNAGVPVTLVDAAPLAGGQYYRQDALRGKEKFELPVEHLASTVVWAVEPVGGGHRLHVRTGPADAVGRSGRTIDAAALVLATGAYDRALPFPGWDLPGVYTAGAAQALAKGQRIAVGKRVVLAGTGPFLLAVAAAVVRAGGRVVAIHEANDPVLGWLSTPRGMLAGYAKTGELARFAATLARHRVPFYRRSTVIAAHGTDRVEAVTTAALDRDWHVLPGTERRVEADAVCVGYGFTPQLELAVSANCVVRAGFVVVDAAQTTSVPGVFAAGELTGIGGAALAAAEGTVAGVAAAKFLGAQVNAPARAFRRIRAGRRFAAALAQVYPVRPGWREWLRDDTLVCRCEEVGYGELRQAVADRGVAGARPLRLVSRVGLGHCQGRVCGSTVAELTGLSVDAFARRPIAAPVRLGELSEEA